MKRALITVWNVCLLLFVLFWTFAIIPKVMLQFSGLHLFPPGTSRARAIMFGLEGIGLLMTIAATSASFCSLFWREVAKHWRLAFGVIFAVLAAGTFIAEWIKYLDDRKYLPPTSGVSLDGDHVAFFLSISLFLLPLVVFGRSYPNLAMIACSRIFNRRNLVTNDAGSDSSEAVHESDSAKRKSMTN